MNNTTASSSTTNIQGVQENNNFTPTSPNTTTTLTPNKYKKPRSNSFIHERSPNFTSPLRERANSISSELILSTPLRSSNLSIHRKSVQGKPFTLDVSLNIRLTYIFKRISEEINVQVGNIALYFTVVGMYTTSEEKRFETIPVTYTTFPPNASIQEVIKALKLSSKVNTKYCVYYRILPYTLCDEEGHDRRDTMRFLDFLIVDERIKYWRRLYLEHIKTQPIGAISGSNGSNKELTSGTDEAASTSAVVLGMKRTRTNSEGSTISTRTKPSEVRIIWPEDTLLSEYDGLEVNTASICAEKNCTLADLCGKLRETLGIPVNIAELEALKPSAADPTAANIGDIFAAAPNLMTAACTGLNGVCSDHLHIAETDDTTGSGDTTALVDNKKELLPSFPLLLYNIRNLEEVECLSSDCLAKPFIQCM